MQNKEANRIDSEETNQIVRIDYISSGLGHLRALISLSYRSKKPGMSEYLFRKRNIQAHQENGPVNRMETNDILSD